MPVTLTLHRRSDFVRRLTVHDHAVGRAAKAKSIKSARCKKAIDAWFFKQSNFQAQHTASRQFILQSRWGRPGGLAMVIAIY